MGTSRPRAIRGGTFREYLSTSKELDTARIRDHSDTHKELRGTPPIGVPRPLNIATGRKIMAAPHNHQTRQRETPGPRLGDRPGVQLEHQTVAPVRSITTPSDSTVPASALHRALRYLNHASPLVREAFLLGTRIGREQMLDGLNTYTAHNLRRFLNEELGAPPWATEPIAGYDYPLTEQQRREMFTTTTAAERRAAA